jgi:predicted dinucleotide-binding enzyme
MRIALFGTGGMAEALGTAWSRAGHDLAVAGRTPHHAEKLAGHLTAGGNRATARALSWSAAADFADVILLAVPTSSVDALLPPLDLDGKILVDCTNSAGPTGAEPPPGTPIAERIAELAPGASVVKAFNLVHVDVWRMTPPVFAGRPVAVPLCGAPEAVETVSALVRDIGCTPVPAGDLTRAALLEATAALVIGLWMSGVDAQAILAPA